MGVTCDSVPQIEGINLKTALFCRCRQPRASSTRAPQNEGITARRPCSASGDCLTCLKQSPRRGASPREFFLCEWSVLRNSNMQAYTKEKLADPPTKKSVQDHPVLILDRASLALLLIIVLAYLQVSEMQTYLQVSEMQKNRTRSRRSARPKRKGKMRDRVCAFVIVTQAHGAPEENEHAVCVCVCVCEKTNSPGVRDNLPLLAQIRQLCFPSTTGITDDCHTFKLLSWPSQKPISDMLLTER